jgi:hypothetical protein
MFIKYFTSSIIVFAVLFAGCSSPALLDQHWGRSAETARFNQTLNPDAAKDNDPVTEMDGQSAVNTYNGYRDSFKRQETSSGYDITVTGIGEKK